MVSAKRTRTSTAGTRSRSSPRPHGAATAALNEIARIATADLELQPMLQRITDTLAASFDWEFVALVRVDEHAGRFVCEALTSRLPTEVHVGYGRELGSGVVGRVALSGQPITIDDAATYAGFVDTLPGARAELCVPVRHRDRVVAILNLESTRPGAFRGRLPLLETIAEQIAGAIASARLLEEARRRASDLETLSEVARIATSSADLQRVLARVVTYIRRRFDLSLVSVLLTGPGRRRFDFEASAATEPTSVATDTSWPVDVGVVGRVIRTGLPQLVENVQADPDYFAVTSASVAEFAVPIRFRRRILGALNLEAGTPGFFTPDVCRLFELVADQLAGALHLTSINRRLKRTKQELQQTNRRLREANRVLGRLTVVDGLTHVANRRGFDHVIDLEWRRAQRTREPLALLLIDVDCFKALNDTWGHQHGDACLREVARALGDGVRRASDMVARYGGEEFAVILPTTPGDAAVALAEQLRARVEALCIAHGRSTVSPHVTVSVGAASLVPDHETSVRTLIAAADRALYRAKATGRNRVAAAPPASAGA